MRGRFGGAQLSDRTGELPAATSECFFSALCPPRTQSAVGKQLQLDSMLLALTPLSPRVTNAQITDRPLCPGCHRPPGKHLRVLMVLPGGYNITHRPALCCLRANPEDVRAPTWGTQLTRQLQHLLLQCFWKAFYLLQDFTDLITSVFMLSLGGTETENFSLNKLQIFLNNATFRT